MIPESRIHESGSTQHEAQWAPRLAIAAGIVFSLALLWLTKPYVYFSGDGGVKAVLVEQFARGVMHIDVRLTDEPWVEALWTQGLYPLGDFAYRIDGKWFTKFEYVFPFVTSPLYLLLGYRGMYALPLAALWVTWILCNREMRNQQLGPRVRVLLLVGLIFGSPLTLYGAMFWEHTLAVALSFAGLREMLSKRPRNSGLRRALIAGVLLGAAPWFRPECFAMVPAVLAASWPGVRQRIGPRRWWAFFSGALLAVALFLASNVWVYGLMLGTHGIEVMDPMPLLTRLADFVTRVVWLGRNFVQHAPIVVFALAAILYRGRWVHRQGNAAFLAAAAAIYFVGAAAIVPSTGGLQIGPRFLFPAIPIVFILCSLLIREAPRVLPRARNRLAAVLVTTVILGCLYTVVIGTLKLEANYRGRIEPALAKVESLDHEIVGISSANVAMELSHLLPRRPFFLLDQPEDLTALLSMMHSRGETRLLVIVEDLDGRDPGDSPGVLANPSPDVDLAITPLGQHGRFYFFYEVTLLRGHSTVG